MTLCLIALGSNLGDRRHHLTIAVDKVDAVEGVSVSAVSSLYETAPVGGPDNQGPYLNAALTAEVSLAARALLEHLHRIEADHERERIVRWGARTLDLDLLTFGGEIRDDDDLLLPHPRMHLRRFVMVPVCDIQPELRHPTLGKTMQQLLDELPVEQGDLMLAAKTWTATTVERHSQ